MSRPKTELRGSASQKIAAMVTWIENLKRKIKTDQTPNKIPKHLTRNVPQMSGRFDTYAYVHAMRGLHTFATLPLSLRFKQTFKTNGDDANNSNDQTNKPSTWDIRHQWPTGRKTIQTETHRQHMTQISSNRREDVVVHRRGSSPRQPCRHDMLTYSCGSMVSIHTNRLPTIMQRTCVQEQQWPTHPRDSPNVEIETTHDENMQMP